MYKLYYKKSNAELATVLKIKAKSFPRNASLELNHKFMLHFWVHPRELKSISFINRINPIEEQSDGLKSADIVPAVDKSSPSAALNTLFIQLFCWLIYLCAERLQFKLSYKLLAVRY